MPVDINLIRNFAIIAHVDHGKSTLADRFLELTGVIKKGAHQEQFLDRNPISRERGITIKLAPVRMTYQLKKFENLNSKSQIISKSQIQNKKIFGAPNLEFSTLSNSEYILNLIDTPGHVDFSYEVDRTLACVEGVILLVDATAGVQAQTIANAYKAVDKNLVIIPVVNKIDLPNADVEGTKKQLMEFLAADFELRSGQVYEVSARTGEGVEKLLEAVIQKIPSPKARYRVFHSSGNPPPTYHRGNPKPACRTGRSFKTGIFASNNSLQALIFDSYYDSHRGVIAFVRVFEGELKNKDKVKLASANVKFEVLEVGYFQPDLNPTLLLSAGDIGYVVTNLKDIHQVRVGDTIIDEKSLSAPLTGYKKVKPMVFASIFPTISDEYLNLKRALEKLYLNDSSLIFSVIHSSALGAGFRVGFLGLLHADVVRERLEREYDLNIVLTPPQVGHIKNNNVFLEPQTKVMIVTPQKYLGEVMQLCQNYRAKFETMNNKNQLVLIYEMPMSEMVSDFFDRLKSVTSGYASFDWEFSRYLPVKADKLTILLNGDEVEEFSEIVVCERAFKKAQALVKKIREIIPRQQFEVRVQAKYKGKIIASERIVPFRKDVTRKLYGGDRTRKDKLLDKQKEGKKKMKMIGKVEIPKEAFLKLFER